MACPFKYNSIYFTWYMVCLSAFLTTKRLGFFLDFDSNSNTPKEWKDLAHSPLGILPKNEIEVM